MMPRSLFVAIPAFLVLTACDDMMATGGGDSLRNPGAIAPETTATTPAGTLAAQVATPANASECQLLAARLEDDETDAVGRQAALDQRDQLGCPAVGVTGNG